MNKPNNRTIEQPTNHAVITGDDDHGDRTEPNQTLARRLTARVGLLLACLLACLLAGWLAGWLAGVAWRYNMYVLVLEY